MEKQPTTLHPDADMQNPLVPAPEVQEDNIGPRGAAQVRGNPSGPISPLLLGGWQGRLWQGILEDMDRIPGIFTFNNDAYDAKCDFFMWCDEVQNFVDSQITCGKDENLKTLEYRVARLEDDRKDLNCIVNKTKMVVKVLPEAFLYLNIVDEDDGSQSD
ncbi:hypothetical protein Taro_044827 [Colocasia esculenta]|uniref:Uncharacterized protein n=1 Tax=Colocasia esculenta TaxID=4460 RepID=A0A843WMV1_COLES|nr:hypothetical protein [Colocasia esculenta]